ncbi:unnamed protein product [Mytilus coruscus]|uniref:Reverse transcriptase zinc-binding domain-containing protein n=1 Tax=Mytilus coruscus TaxID=42192 RepID=A0A6J8AMI6_MYTCO|nr:unnamed protein product [Mytilus coruscus]
MNSNSWFIEVKTIILKYDLGNAIEWLDIQMKKEELLMIYSCLGKYIQYCESSTNLQETAREYLPRSTGTYILQPLRYKIYKEGTEDHCIACDCKEETLEHLLIECEAWNYLRDPILQTIKNLLTTNGDVREEDLTCEMTIQVLMDITKIQKIYRVTSDLMSQIEF